MSTIGAPDGLRPAYAQHILAREGGPELLFAIIRAQEVWSSLTRPQRAALTYPTKEDVNPRTLAALTRKGLWGDIGRTEYGDQVVRFSTSPPPPCPECRAGAHANCDGTTWDATADALSTCPCFAVTVERGEDHAHRFERKQ